MQPNSLDFAAAHNYVVPCALDVVLRAASLPPGISGVTVQVNTLPVAHFTQQFAPVRGPVDRDRHA
jgi:hypothetical protein